MDFSGVTGRLLAKDGVVNAEIGFWLFDRGVGSARQDDAGIIEGLPRIGVVWRGVLFCFRRGI